MDQHLASLLREIQEFGTSFDSRHSAKKERMRNVTPATGELLRFLVGLTKAQHTLEIGTSNGYSTLWLAAAAKETGGRVTTLEIDPYKTELAGKNFAKAGLDSFINLVTEDAGAFLRKNGPELYDFIFMDSDRVEYSEWWPDLLRVMKNGGLIVVDNAVSHQDEISPFQEMIMKSDKVRVVSLPIEQGLILVHKL